MKNKIIFIKDNKNFFTEAYMDKVKKQLWEEVKENGDMERIKQTMDTLSKL